MENERSDLNKMMTDFMCQYSRRNNFFHQQQSVHFINSQTGNEFKSILPSVSKENIKIETPDNSGFKQKRNDCKQKVTASKTKGKFTIVKKNMTKR